MKKYDKRSSQTSSELHSIYVSSHNDRHPFTKIFMPLHYVLRHFTSSHLKLHPTTLHSTSLHLSTLHYSYLNFTQTTVSFGLTPFKFPTASVHPTSLHFTNITTLLFTPQ